MKKRTNESGLDGIVLLAKKAGPTSFASLSAVKRALGTTHVGHTGTLDSFADGLLVVLVGRMTHLVSHITGMDKTYRAVIAFGEETDTLERTGKIVKKSRVPSEEEVRAVLPRFLGEILQTPPLFSALHVNGKRASDLAREGKSAEIPPRKITIHSIELLDFSDGRALVEVRCSKGTYIRALARDIAYALDSCAHLVALRRTSVGKFRLEDAVGQENLGAFSISASFENARFEENRYTENETDFFEKIRSQKKEMTAEIAKMCSLVPVSVSPYFADDFSHGRPLRSSMFFSRGSLPSKAQIAVFYPKGKFAGIVKKVEKKFSYGFVIPLRNQFSVYSWKDVTSGKVCHDFFENKSENVGSALTIGSFDGPHLGHDALFDAVLFQKNNSLVPGVVTFTKSLRSFKNPQEYEGDVATLSQRLKTFAAKGFSFAVVIDFSDEFAKIDGSDFLSTLVDFCKMRFLAEGKDFRCGYQGSTDMTAIGALALERNFVLRTIDSVLYNGERVSSSRIRACIGNADFSSAAYMLERPFALDCSDFSWTQTRLGEKNMLLAHCKKNQENQKNQVFPPDGTYRVTVIRAFSRKNGLQSGEAQSSVRVFSHRSDCMLENGTLRLSFSGKLIEGWVKAIQFGYPDENNFLKE